MNNRAVPFVEHPVAIVAGYPALVVGMILREAVRTGALARLRVPEGERWDEVERVVYAIERAGRAWRDTARDQTISAAGNNEALSRKPSDDCFMTTHRDNEIGTADVAAMLGVCERRVRQLANEPGGRHVAGRWLFARAAVLAYRDHQENHAS